MSHQIAGVIVNHSYEIDRFMVRCIIQRVV